MMQDFVQAPIITTKSLHKILQNPYTELYHNDIIMI